MRGLIGFPAWPSAISRLDADGPFQAKQLRRSDLVAVFMRILKYTNEAVFLTRLRSLEAIWFGQSLVTIDRVGEGGGHGFSTNRLPSTALWSSQIQLETS